MPSPSMTLLLRQLRDQPGCGLDSVSPARCASVLGVDGICATLASTDEGLFAWQLVWGSDPVSEALLNLKYRLVEGPGIQVALWGTAILVPVLASPSYRDRWPSYTREALALGVQAVFAFPLRRANTPYGAIFAHRRSAGSLRSVEDATAFAEAAEKVLARGADRT
jgi:hypothetical protein